MGNEQSTNSSVFDEDNPEVGRRPTDLELILLFRVQQKLITRLVESPFHIGLLRRYWSAMTNKPFERKSLAWKTIGAQSENPGIEFRPAGQLGLECLVIFCENHTSEAHMMNRINGYPFIKAGIALARVLCEIFCIINEHGQKGKFPVTPTLYYQLLENDSSFFQLFSYAFIVLDEVFCENKGQGQSQLQNQCSQAILVDIVDATKQKVLRALNQAPSSLSELTNLSPNIYTLIQSKQNYKVCSNLLPCVASTMHEARNRSEILPSRLEFFQPKQPLHAMGIEQSTWSSRLDRNKFEIEDTNTANNIFDGLRCNV